MKQVTVEDVVALLEKPKKTGNGWQARCPAHDDKRPSLSVSRGDDGRALLYCHKGCSYPDIMKALGLDQKYVFPYNSNGKQRYHVVKTSDKRFPVFMPNGTAGIGDIKRVLYNVDSLKTSTEDDFVFVPEGEKDVDTLTCLGLTAVCNPHGAGKWRDEYSDALRGRNVVVLQDNDESGEKHAAQVSESLLGKAKEVRIIEFKELPEKGDVTEWFTAGGTAAELVLKAVSAVRISEYLPFEEIDLSKGGVKEITWRWPNKIPSGCITMLSGDGGVGKGFLSIYMACVVSKGGDWPDGSGKAEKGKVLYITNEDRPEKVLLPRIIANGGDVSLIKPVNGYCKETKTALSLREGIDRLRENIVRSPDIKMIIIDPITEFLHTGLNDEGDIRRVLVPLSLLADEFDITILAINHFNKKSDEPISTRSMGSGAFQHVARSVWVVLPDKDDDEVKCFMPSKANYCKKPMSLKFTVEDVGSEFILPSTQYGRVIWRSEGFYGNVDEYGRRNKDSQSSTEKAEEWLRTYLENDKVVDSAVLFKDARKDGIGRDACYEAKKAMGIVPKPAEFQGSYLWSLPKDAL